ncbi:MAG: hypothetical protein WED33_01625 [Bacteroidia bacterium]
MHNSNSNSKTLLSAVLVLTLLLSSCLKNKDLDDDTSAAQNENMAENYFSELSSISDQVATTGDLSGYKLSEDQGTLLATCAVITIDTSSNVSAQNPNIFTIDFGSGCQGTDGKLRVGKIIITATGRYLDEGTVITITPENYSVNGNLVNGSRIVTNLGENALGQPSFSVSVNGTIVLANNGGTITWNANRIRTWTTGFNTPLLFFDDEYSISGSSTGTKVNGQSWTAQINTALLYRHSCRQIVTGTITINPQDRPERLVNFGNGDCDYTASVTINGNTYTFTLL